VEQFIKLTRNKRRFYQQGMRAATLILSISIAFLSPPSPNRLLRQHRSNAPSRRAQSVGEEFWQNLRATQLKLVYHSNVLVAGPKSNLAFLLRLT
jgi:hypothetical protein